MKEITRDDLHELRSQFKGKKFYKLIQAHLEGKDMQHFKDALAGYSSVLPQEAQPLVVEFVDFWNQMATDSTFWKEDASIVFVSIVDYAKDLFEKNNIKYNANMLFNMFQIIVLNFGYSAIDQPQMQRFMGIKRRKIFGIF